MEYKLGELFCGPGGIAWGAANAQIQNPVILSILVYTFFSRMFDLMLPSVVKHSTAVV